MGGGGGSYRRIWTTAPPARASRWAGWENCAAQPSSASLPLPTLRPNPVENIDGRAGRAESGQARLLCRCLPGPCNYAGPVGGQNRPGRPETVISRTGQHAGAPRLLPRRPRRQALARAGGDACGSRPGVSSGRTHPTRRAPVHSGPGSSRARAYKSAPPVHAGRVRRRPSARPRRAGPVPAAWHQSPPPPPRARLAGRGSGAGGAEGGAAAAGRATGRRLRRSTGGSGPDWVGVGLGWVGQNIRGSRRVGWRVAGSLSNILLLLLGSV